MFKTREQQVVVETRISMGYESQELPNGNWLLWKGKHKMVINCFGYNCYIQVGNLK